MKTFLFIITVFNLTDWLNKILVDKYIDKINLEMNKLIQYILCVCIFTSIFQNINVFIKIHTYI